jgi:hypothetical protein
MRRLGRESAARLVQRLVLIVPTSAAQLVKSAVERGKLMMFGRDPERDRGLKDGSFRLGSFMRGDP